MASFSAERREARLREYCEPDKIISDRAYNVVLGATVLYGVIVNILLCTFVGNIYYYMNPIVFLIGYFILAFAGSTIAYRSNNPAISFLGYNMIVVPVGLVISSLVSVYGGVSSGVVLEAFYYTALVTAIMIVAALAFPDIFERIGGFLFVSLIAILISSFIGMFFAGFSNMVAWFAAVIFSLYIGYDFHRSQMFPRTVDNAIDCALDIYLDIANLFIRILQILGRRD